MRPVVATRALWLALILALPVPGAPAQMSDSPEENPRRSFVHQAWTVEDGLPVNHVNQLYQTPNGYLWMATFDGLVRFDGVRFTVYNAANTPGLPSNRLVTIQPGRGTSFWLTTEQNHLIRFDQGDIRSYVSGQAFHRAGVFLDGDSAVWVATRTGVFQEESGELVPFAPGIIRGRPVRHILRSSSGDLWFAMPDGVLRIGKGAATHFDVHAAGAGGVHRLTEDAGGTIWAAGSGIARFADRAFRKVVSEEAPWVGDDPPSIFGIRVDGHGRTIVSAGRGLFEIAAGGVRPLGPVADWRPFGTAVQKGGALATCPDGTLWALDRGRLYQGGDFVMDTGLDSRTLLCDQEGNLWITTAGEGLHRFRPALIQTVRPADHTSSFNVYGVFEDRHGSIWFGSRGFLGRLLTDGQVESHPSSDLDGPTAAFLDAAGGALWAGRHLCRPERRTDGGGCTRFEIESILPSDVYAIMQSRDDALWFGTNVGVFRRRRGTWRHFTTEDGLPHLFVRFFLETRDGSLWMSTNGGGIARYAESEANEPAFQAITMADGLPSNNVRGLHEDRNGIIWIATEDLGLARLDPDTGHITQIRASDGLYQDGLHAILEDKDGRLWMSTNNGIFSIARDELDAFALGRIDRVRSTFYTERDGMRNREANGGFQNAALRTGDGRLWFASQDGAVVIDPDKIEASPAQAAVIIEELTTSAGSVHRVGGAPIEISADERSFAVRYTSPNFTAPERTRFRYRLDGFDNDWVLVDNRREAIYTRVPPGTYSLRVSASSGNDEWNDGGLPLIVTVAPYFYETWWFVLLCIVAGLLLVGSVFRYRIHKMRQRETKLKSEVRARTSELRAANALMEKQADQLRALDRAKSRFFADVSHEFRTPLTMTLGPLRDLRDGRVGSIDDRAREQVTIALRNGRRLHRLTNQLLDLARLEAGFFTVERLPGDLAAYLQTLAGPFVAAAERADISFSVHVPPKPVVVAFDPDHLDKVFANLVSNALKFTPAGGAVVLRLHVTAERAVVTVEDTGRGIAPRHLPHIFDRFFQGSKSEMQPGTGIGLSLARQIAELHGATIDVESTEGVGSTFTVRMPRADAVEYADLPPVQSSSNTLGVAEVRESMGANEFDDPGEVVDSRDVTTVLIVDDNADIRAYVRRHLAAGYRIAEALDGREALETIRSCLPDLIISDVMMPHLDGFRLLRSLRSDPETDFIPIILLTARAEAEDRLAGLGLGADDYITKPFDARELSARVDNLIAQRRRLKSRYAAARAASDGRQTIHALPSDAKSAEAIFLEQVRAVVEHHMADEEFGVEEMALEIGQSRSTLHRQLTDVTGESPSHLLRRMRLERGADLLRRRAGTVSEIAYAVGFKSVAHFSTSFREHFDQTPTAYQAGTTADDEAAE